MIFKNLRINNLGKLYLDEKGLIVDKMTLQIVQIQQKSREDREKQRHNAACIL